MPVVLEVRPGVYGKNAQVAHIHGVKGPRYRANIPAEVRDSFSNLLLLCYPHHSEVDADEDRYPPELLQEWKKKHENPEVSTLNSLTLTDPDQLMEALTEIASPPLDRLEAITERLEETGVANAETVAELKHVLGLLSSSEAGVDARSARALAFAGEIFSSINLDRSARSLAETAEILPDVLSRIEQAMKRMSQFE